jgi:curli biogenesis system outer membrane secretion channel CsgG
MTQLHSASLSVLLLGLLTACATERHRNPETHQVEAATKPYSGPRHPLAIGKFKNTSTYLTGVFASDQDQLGGQAKTILKTHLSATNRFQLADRDNMEEIAREAQLAGKQQALVGARFVVTGEVTEFGRKETGDKQVFGVLGRGKEQAAYAKVSLNVVDTTTGLVVYSTQGAGEYSLSNREVLGTGSTAAYDSTLNGKVLDLAVVNAVNKLVTGLESGAWTVSGS